MRSRAMLVLALALLVPVAASAQVNNSAANAWWLWADGTSISDQFGIDTSQWYGSTLESGKSYVLEANVPAARYSDPAFPTPGLWDQNGTTPLTNVDLNCNTSGQTPSFPTSTGFRCTLRPKDSVGVKEMRISLFGQLTQFRIRLRESTIYSRWTTNGYNMYIALQNTSVSGANLTVMLLSDAPSYPPTPVVSQNVTVGGFGSAQLVFLAGSLSPNRGTVRVLAGPPNFLFVPGQITVQAYGFNPTTNTYLPFQTERVNDGKTTW